MAALLYNTVAFNSTPLTLGAIVFLGPAVKSKVKKGKPTAHIDLKNRILLPYFQDT